MNYNIFETDPAKKLFPKFVFKRIRITKQIETFYYKIDFSSGYFLRRIHCKFPALCKDPTLTPWTPGLAIAPGQKIIPSIAWQALNPGFNLIAEDTGAGGITGIIEPIWPRTFGIAVVDNTANYLTKTAYYIQAPRLYFSAFDNAHSIARQSEPTQADLIGTPSQENAFLIEAPAPVDQDIYGLNFNCPNPPSISSSLNWIYKYGDVIKIEITGQTEQAITTGTIWTPNFLDLFLIGYYIPTGTLENF